MARKKIKLTPKKGRPPAKMARGGVLESGMFTPLRKGRDATDKHLDDVRRVTDLGLKAFRQTWR